MGPGWSLKRLAFGALFARFLCPGSYNSFCWLVRLLFVLSIPSITDSDLSYYYGGSRCRDFCLLVAGGRLRLPVFLPPFTYRNVDIASDRETRKRVKK
jgi:hypothetical protein